MAFWHRRERHGPVEPGPASIAARDDAVRTLAGRLSDLESAVRRLQVEWADTLDRVTKMAGRVAKRAERAAQVEDEPMNGAQSPAMVEVMKRRARGWPGGGRNT